MSRYFARGSWTPLVKTYVPRENARLDILLYYFPVYLIVVSTYINSILCENIARAEHKGNGKLCLVQHFYYDLCMYVQDENEKERSDFVTRYNDTT